MFSGGIRGDESPPPGPFPLAGGNLQLCGGPMGVREIGRGEESCGPMGLELTGFWRSIDDSTGVVRFRPRIDISDARA